MDATNAMRQERFSHPRLVVLQAMEKRPHRYRWIRGLTMTLTLGLLFLVPLSGLARFDLYGGDHRALFRPATLFVGLIAVSVAIFSFYFVTFQFNLVAGRMFCGWGCPVGQLNRLTDASKASRGRVRTFWAAVLGGFALVLSLSVSLWWTSAEVYLAFPANLIAIGAVLGLGACAVAFARVYGWGFCEKACPIGLYYSVVQQKRPLGILFERSNCLDEAACVKACPVHLDPRTMSTPKVDIGGFAIEGLAFNNHCLRCGACVEACELVTSKIGAPALGFGRPAAIEDGPLVPIDPVPKAVQTSPIAMVDPIAPEPDRPPLSKAATVSIGLSIAVAFGAITTYVLVVGGPRYKPAATWQNEARAADTTSGYRAAAGPFSQRDLEGRVVRGSEPVVGAVVRGLSPGPGAALVAKGPIPIFGDDGRWLGRPLVMSTADRIDLSNLGNDLHTFHIAREGRAVRQLSVPAHSKKEISPPPPGEYEVRCDTHQGELGRLWVFDHPYYAVTDQRGEFQIRSLPEAPLQLSTTAGDRTARTVVDPSTRSLVLIELEPTEER